MTPLTFEPILKRIRWGGRRLGELLNKKIGPESDYAESWELADHGDDQSIVTHGTHAGRTLRQLMQQSGNALLGRHAGLDQFPLLIKFLDANDWLSLQVHPNDEQAKRYDAAEKGKTEAWVIIEARPGSQICAGLKSGVDRQQLAAHLQKGTIEECLNMVAVKAGDCIFVPAGTVHAIGPGIVLAEIQQQSDLTFRLHDWGRLGSDGQPREIHVDDSLACTDFCRGPVLPVTPSIVSHPDNPHEELVRDQFFVIHRYRTIGPVRIPIEDQFHILMALDGTISMDTDEGTYSLAGGSTMLVPASVQSVTLKSDEPATVLDIFLP